MSTRRLARPSKTAALWAPILMGLAYLPDIATQVVALAGGGDVSVATHSVLFAILVSVVVGSGLAKLGTTTFRGGTLICLFSVLLHDGLDLIQSTQRQPWWPLSDRVIGFNETPIEPRREVALFGIAFVLFIFVRWLFRHRRSRETNEAPAALAGASSLRWTSRILMGVIILAACGTHYLRGLRELAYEEVRREIHEGRYEAALAAAERAERWPSTSKPGRLDCARGEIYAALGDRERADAAFERGLQADPHYFWGLADAAAFHAASEKPANLRRAKVQPYLDQLEKEFADHEAWPRQRERIERRLNRPTTSTSRPVPP